MEDEAELFPLSSKTKGTLEERKDTERIRCCSTQRANEVQKNHGVEPTNITQSENLKQNILLLSIKVFRLFMYQILM